MEWCWNNDGMLTNSLFHYYRGPQTYFPKVRIAVSTDLLEPDLSATNAAALYGPVPWCLYPDFEWVLGGRMEEGRVLETPDLNPLIGKYSILYYLI